MDHIDKLIKGKLARDCDEKRKEITLDDDGRIIAMKGYCRAKDFRRGEV